MGLHAVSHIRPYVEWQDKEACAYSIDVTIRIRDIRGRFYMDDVTVSVAENGRLVLPVALRRRLNVAKGGTIVVREEDGRLLLESLDDAIGRAQALVRRFAPDATGVVDEFLADRRAEAEGESA